MASLNVVKSNAQMATGQPAWATTQMCWKICLAISELFKLQNAVRSLLKWINTCFLYFGYLSSGPLCTLILCTSKPAKL